MLHFIISFHSPVCQVDFWVTSIICKCQIWQLLMPALFSC